MSLDRVSYFSHYIQSLSFLVKLCKYNQQVIIRLAKMIDNY